jgi:hypothetical protein
MKKISMMVMLAMAVLGATACGDDPDAVCEEAEEIMNGCNNGLELSIKECNGETRAWAECVVDYPDEACGEDTSDNDAFDSCVFQASQQ